MDNLLADDVRVTTEVTAFKINICHCKSNKFD